MMDVVPTLWLLSDSLLSKWGFSDGDPFEDVAEWWHAQHGDPLMGQCGCGYFDLGVDDAALLRQLVDRYLVPALDQQVQLVNIETSHNPVRAEVVDGAPIAEDVWYLRATGPTLTPEAVGVPYETVIEVAAELRAAA